MKFWIFAFKGLPPNVGHSFLPSLLSFAARQRAWRLCSGTARADTSAAGVTWGDGDLTVIFSLSASPHSSSATLSLLRDNERSGSAKCNLFLLLATANRGKKRQWIYLHSLSVSLCLPRLVLISFNEAQISSAIFIISSAVATSCTAWQTLISAVGFWPRNLKLSLAKRWKANWLLQEPTHQKKECCQADMEPNLLIRLSEFWK